MKINKLMLAMAVAASAFTACNKQETTPVVENQLGNRSIVLNIANLLPTKSPDTALEAGQVALNNFQVFFSDGTKLYTPKNTTASAEAETFFAETKETQKQFHFLDNNVDRVIVVGNLKQKFPVVNGQTTEADLEAVIKRLTLESQLDETNLTLYGWDNTLSQSNLTFNPNEHVDQEDQHPTPVMMAEVELMPTVARFEVNSFEYAQVKETVKDPETGEVTETGKLLPRDYTSMTIDNVSMINFYNEADITLPTEGKDGINAVPTITVDQESKDLYFGQTWDENDIYQEYFTEMDKVTEKPWWFDVVGHELKTNAYSWDVSVPQKDEEGNQLTDKEGNPLTYDCYAYHTFPTLVPTFNVELTGLEQGITSLLYLQTKNLKDETGAVISTIEPGKIYKMNFVFDDSILQDAEKCIDVKIEVHDWVVVNVTPEF